jgi:hypothetical protein
MRRRGVVIALWLVFAFVTWNVVFDRYVATDAVEFTREQIVRRQQGEPVTSIHEGFTPRVGRAAIRASLWTMPIVAAGAVAAFLTFRRTG